MAFFFESLTTPIVILATLPLACIGGIWGIIPFEQLDPQWKVVQMDGVSPIQKDFDPEVYPLTVGFALHGDAPEIIPIRNRDPEKMTDLMLTGVTAMVRGTALTMERKGISKLVSVELH